MNGNDILKLGFKPGKVVGLALHAARQALADGATEDEVRQALAAVLAAPEAYTEDGPYKAVARELMKLTLQPQGYHLETSAPYQIWGEAHIEAEAIAQLKRAVRLPVAVRGALMPDAHVGYGLPIGGVLATYNSVIPYAVGVDIACRMRLTIFDVPPIVLEQKRERFRKAIEDNTCFGAGEAWETPRDHPVLQDPLWREHPVARQFRDVAWRQLGSSGSGNHFVEFGELDVREAFETPLGLVPPGKYVALLSHSGSRRFGYEIANHYTKIAMNQRATLPKDYLHLAWLDLDREAGAEYWEAMQLAGRYASANHAVIHQQIIADLRFEVLGGVENHHNFAWREVVDGQEVIVHRKGATPAGMGVLGVIPGSMSAPGYVVRGLGKPESLCSAAHGAGRKMSRAAAMKTYDWGTVRKKLKAQGVELISAGLDEVPNVYKDIEQVMADQSDLVAILAEFKPKLVKMDGSGKSTFRED